jgi:hypothetical protein
MNKSDFTRDTHRLERLNIHLTNSSKQQGQVYTLTPNYRILVKV